MVALSVVGYPRIGARRELKKVVEGYFKGHVPKEDLLAEAKKLRKIHWQVQKEKGIDLISSNDFSFYDTFLDTALMLNAVPNRYKEIGLDQLDTCFAMARGYQDEKYDVKALEMKKWFNTNYHYVVPEIEDGVEFKLNSSKVFDEYQEALELGIKTKPVLIGPFTFLKLAKIKAAGKKYFDYCDQILRVYEHIFNILNELAVEFVQIDEPKIVMDLTGEDINNFVRMYEKLLPQKGKVKVILQTYFGDIRDIYKEIVSLNFDAVALDLVEGEKNIELIAQYGFPGDKLLFAGLINGKNIWRNNYRQTMEKLQTVFKYVNKDRVVLNTSCSLLHVPYTLKGEVKIAEKYKQQLAFAEEKLTELSELRELLQEGNYLVNKKFIKNAQIKKEKITNKEFYFEDVRTKINNIKDEDFIRKPSFDERIKKQQEILKLPFLPTTTIGSFPQTSEVRKLRRAYKKGEITLTEYRQKIKEKIREVIELQEEIGLDVLVHGEFERNDMVEYFGENLAGFLFTENGWVQSYGTRCVKPPIIFGDVKREKPITVEWIKYAQSLTEKPVKGMLTGPITILNWSFPREDISLKEIAFQIALAIKEEVMDLEAAGIKIIQIDEAALREKLPLRKEDWQKDYLDWAIKSFRFVHSSVKPETQIHTHMCYSEFADIIKEIEAMDADVISFEAAKSDLSLLDTLKEHNYSQEVGPGVYDIHSPRIPKEKEIEEILLKISQKLDINKVWVNPDCGLKTRDMAETVPSLKNMVNAAQKIRLKFKG
ncbi:5-methyltetrahydropteroyltriglutamate--homocysteine methyltransferase [Desulfohalotomaculum tongense]|uniref:5-methyltetrahydropteroyltriglutamate-- homocysteine S-methyltransferase n=1 Tax=Desulforadius tongensis TaxID=1216062 RepID=UPI001956192B|nr:5-methyltetrahydropteroyltriglutamate--homocysteine S-methyltransferase [Desulforadius tongensis]MBM7855084.1 5-methyltetrahydropteroyltriglutamate--homocysteine methyltransferase [Desulforadius tongensis]